MKEKKTIARREFLENIGKSAGTLAMLRTMIAMGLGLGSSGCGSSSAGAAQEPNNISSTNITNNTVAVNNSTSIIKSPRPGDWNTNIGNGKTVIILGAGIAGMSSAFELQKLGVKAIGISPLEMSPLYRQLDNNNSFSIIHNTVVECNGKNSVIYQL